MGEMVRMLALVALLPLAACPDDQPIDFSKAKNQRREMPAMRAPSPQPRPTMPEGALPFELVVVHAGPTLALAPELVLFDRNILRKRTSPADTYAGEPAPYQRPISVTPVGVAARLDEKAGAIALFVNRDGSAIETLYLLDDLKLSQVAVAARVRSSIGQLPYAFGAADPTVRDRVQIDLSQDEIAIGEQSSTGSGMDAIRDFVVPIIEARRGQSTIGIEARIGVRAGTTNQRMASLFDALYAARVEALYLVPVQDSTPHSSTSYASHERGLPTVRIGQPSAQGDLDKAIIRRYIKRNIQKITYCYEKELLVSPGLAGTVSVQFFIAPTGLVAQAAASGVSPRVASCVANVIKNIEFPKPKGGGGVQVNYPFTMRLDGE